MNVRPYRSFLHAALPRLFAIGRKTLVVVRGGRENRLGGGNAARAIEAGACKFLARQALPEAHFTSCGGAMVSTP